MNKPNFFLIGAQKAGTTSLSRYLSQHPEIYMSPVKEPFFFMTEGMDGAESTTVNKISEYLRLFDNIKNEVIIGEATSIYLACPWVPRRISEMIPDAKLIAILRNPIDRAWSHYLMHAREGYPMFSSEFTKAIKQTHIYRISDEIWHFGYISQGMYYKQLTRYYSFFDKTQLKIILYDDLIKYINIVMKDIFTFLRIDTSFVPDVSHKHNVSGLTRIKVIKNLMQSENFFKRIFKNYFPEKLRCVVKSKLKKINEYKPSIPPQAKMDLIEIYREDVLRLQDLIGRDLSSWLY